MIRVKPIEHRTLATAFTLLFITRLLIYQKIHQDDAIINVAWSFLTLFLLYLATKEQLYSYVILDNNKISKVSKDFHPKENSVVLNGLTGYKFHLFSITLKFDNNSIKLPTGSLSERSRDLLGNELGKIAKI